MVSLGNDRRRTTGSFNNGPPSITISERDELFDDPRVTLVNGHGSEFMKIPTVWISVLLIFTMMLEGVAAFLLPYIVFPMFCGSDNCKVSAESCLTYSSCFLWCLYFVGERYSRHKHYQSRLLGYLEFYRKTCFLRQVPLLVLSAGNMMLLIIWTTTEDFCDKESSCPILDRMKYMQILICAEVALLLVIQSIYIVKIIRFNRSKAPPDVQQEDVVLSHMHTAVHEQEVGFRNASMDELLDKQSDMIHYLKQHNNLLSKKLLELTAKLEHLEQRS